MHADELEPLVEAGTNGGTKTDPGIDEPTGVDGSGGTRDHVYEIGTG